MPEQKQYIDIPLADLFARIRANDIIVSPGNIIEIEKLLAVSDLSQLPIDTLELILPPILARNNKEQETIQRIIKQYLAENRDIIQKDLFTEETLPTNTTDAMPLEENSNITLMITTIVFIILAFFIWHITKPKIPPKKNVTAAITRKPHAVPLPDSNTRFPDTSKMQWEPDAMHIILRSSNVQQQQHYYIPGLVIIALASIPFWQLIAFLIYRALKKRGKHVQELLANMPVDFSEANSEPLDIKFADQSHLIIEDEKMKSIIHSLRKRQAGDGVRLNIPETVRKTSNNAGLPTFVYTNLSADRTFIILVDKEYPDSHIIQQFEWLIGKLTAASVNIEHYYYRGHLDTIFTEQGNELSFRTLAEDKKDHHLIIFGRGKHFVNEATLLMDNMLAEVLLRWENKAMVTSVPLPDWSYPEKQLRKIDFLLVPAELEAVELMAACIVESLQPEKEKIYKQIEDLYAIKSYDFNKLSDLKIYLRHDRDLLQLVAALAVYPRLNWPVTLALVRTIADIHNENSNTKIYTDYNTLLKLSRIEWMHHGRMDADLRFQLLQELDPTLEIAARKKILEMLASIKKDISPKAIASVEWEIQNTVNGFFLYANAEGKNIYGYDKQQFNNLKQTNEKMERLWPQLLDRSLKNYIEEGENTLMPIGKDGKHMTVEEYYTQAHAKVNRLRRRIAVCIALSLTPVVVWGLLVTNRNWHWVKIYEPQITAFTFKQPPCPTLHGYQLSITAANGKETKTITWDSAQLKKGVIYLSDTALFTDKLYTPAIWRKPQKVSIGFNIIMDLIARADSALFLTDSNYTISILGCTQKPHIDSELAVRLSRKQLARSTSSRSEEHTEAPDTIQTDPSSSTSPPLVNINGHKPEPLHNDTVSRFSKTTDVDMRRLAFPATVKLLEISKNARLKSLEGIETQSSLNQIVISDNPHLVSLSGLEKLSALHFLELRNNNPDIDISAIGQMHALRQLTLSGGNYNFDGVNQTSVTEMNISSEVINLQGFKILKAVRLELKSTEMEDLSWFKNIPSLEYLAIEYGENLSDLSGMDILPKLATLRIANSSLESLYGIEKLNSLHSLTLEWDNEMKNLSGIQNATSLFSLQINYCNALTSLSGIKKLNSLSSLRIAYCDNLWTLSGIENLPIEDLTIIGNKRMDIDAVYKIKTLKKIKYAGIPLNTNILRLQNPTIIIKELK